mmetsp:Transcript_11858/g.32170  ORF Transcript_11858/g.32170 Transcript_11858/m.32170 type:complete len:298 (+) Transcript_11858:3-896(+)
MLHAFGDGNCYMPIAEDLMALYDAARSGEEAALPSVSGRLPFEALQARLQDTLFCRPSPTRASLRGSIFRYVGRGYGFSFGFHPEACALLSRVSSAYRIPLDLALLGLVMCALSRADGSDLVEFTMYTPMRDGASEATMIGLFSDWRDVAVGVDHDLATVLGTLLHVAHTIQHRRWKPFNALRKPDTTVINIQPLDMERRSHFQHLGENLWHGGDELDTPLTRADKMPPSRQAMTFNIEQQDEGMWWVLMDVGNAERPPPWMRVFVHCLQEAVDDFLFDPLVRVHRPVPDLEDRMGR